MVRIDNSHLCGQNSVSGKSNGLSLYFMCSDQQVKCWMPCGFLLASGLLLDTIQCNTHTNDRRVTSSVNTAPFFYQKYKTRITGLLCALFALLLAMYTCKITMFLALQQTIYQLPLREVLRSLRSSTSLLLWYREICFWQLAQIR